MGFKGSISVDGTAMGAAYTKTFPLYDPSNNEAYYSSLYINRYYPYQPFTYSVSYDFQTQVTGSYNFEVGPVFSLGADVSIGFAGFSNTFEFGADAGVLFGLKGPINIKCPGTRKETSFVA